jgi:hypothetical protein
VNAESAIHPTAHGDEATLFVGRPRGLPPEGCGRFSPHLPRESWMVAADEFQKSLVSKVTTTLRARNRGSTGTNRGVRGLIDLRDCQRRLKI